MANYYFLSSIFPAVQIGERPDITFSEWDDLMKNNLSRSDRKKVEVVRRYYDIENVRAFWRGQEELDRYGNMSAVELEEALLTGEALPKYVSLFMEKYTTTESRLKNFSELISRFFSDEIAEQKGFLKRYLQFERDWRLIMISFRAKKIGRDIAYELQYEDPDDPVVAQILAQKDAKSYEPPFDYERLKPIFETHTENPVALHKALLEYRFAMIESFLEIDLFSIDRVLGYTAELIMVEKWLELDKQKGITIVDALMSQ